MHSNAKFLLFFIGGEGVPLESSRLLNNINIVRGLMVILCEYTYQCVVLWQRQVWMLCGPANGVRAWVLCDRITLHMDAGIHDTGTAVTAILYHAGAKKKKLVCYSHYPLPMTPRKTTCSAQNGSLRSPIYSSRLDYKVAGVQGWKTGSKQQQQQQRRRPAVAPTNRISSTVFNCGLIYTLVYKYTELRANICATSFSRLINRPREDA